MSLFPEELKMIRSQSVSSLLLVGCFLLPAGARSVVGQEDAAAGPLVYVGSTTTDALQNVTSVALSADGKFLYAAAYNANAVSVFSRDAETGELEHVQTIRDDELLDAAVALRLSPDGEHAVATSFRASSVALFTRDAESGKLELAASVTDGQVAEAALGFAIDSVWSPDSKFVYVIAPSSAAVNLFRIDAGQLEFVERLDGDALSGARGIAIDSDGRSFYLASEHPGALVAATRDIATGRVEGAEVIHDGEQGVETLSGAFSVAVSRDGKFVYVSSGRFQGDDAVTVFERNDDGKLQLVQSLVNGTDALRNFEGGNEITLSPDERTAYVVASRSHSLSVFRRDPQSGRLTQIQSISRGVQAAPQEGRNERESIPLGTASGVAVSPDGRFIYIAAETDNAIAIFRRPSP